MEPKIIIQGYWDGEPIWRRETIAEVLIRELRKPTNQKDNEQSTNFKTRSKGMEYDR